MLPSSWTMFLTGREDLGTLGGSEWPLWLAYKLSSAFGTQSLEKPAPKGFFTLRFNYYSETRASYQLKIKVFEGGSSEMQLKARNESGILFIIIV